MLEDFLFLTDKHGANWASYANEGHDATTWILQRLNFTFVCNQGPVVQKWSDQIGSRESVVRKKEEEEEENKRILKSD